MSLIPTLYSASPYIELLQGWIGWAGLIILAGVLVLLLVHWRKFNNPMGRTQWMIFILLALITPPVNLFLGFRLPGGTALLPIGQTLDPGGPAVMVLAAVPWVLAGGILGPLPGVILALLAGLTRALWDTHNPFSPFEFAFLALFFSAAVQQRYRTPTYRLLRHPLVTTLLLALLFPFIHLLVTIFTSQGALVSRLDYALTNLSSIALGMAIELLIAGSFAEVIALTIPAYWGEHTPLLPSPAEKSLQTRFLLYMTPLAILVILALVIGDWYVAGQAAREMIKARMSNAADVAAENVPYFLETGQDLIVTLAEDPRLRADDIDELTALLAESIKSVAFFSQLTVLDEQGEVQASYPTSWFVGSQALEDEQIGITAALDGVPFQTFTSPPAPGRPAAQVSFITPILDEALNVQGVLVGRSDLSDNPFTKPLLSSLTTLDEVDGYGVLLDENNHILIHPDPDLIMTTYTGKTPETTLFYDDTAPDGTRQLVYFQPAHGRPWSIAMLVPALSAQQLAVQIAAPLLGMIIIIALLTIIILGWGIRLVTASLKNLTAEAGRLAQGRLDQPLEMDGEDEVGQLGGSFEQMRVSLKARLDELNRLLIVSQGVASSLEIEEAVQPILEAALATGANATRIVLTPAVVPELDGDPSAPISFGLGPSHTQYRELDEQILALTRQQDRLVLGSTTRPRLLVFPPGAARPESLAAVALRHESRYYGSLWIAYDQAHAFSEEEVRFLVTLGGQAALAAANTRLFKNAEIGRQRMEAILASSPDPMLVTDQRDRLLLANPAAWQALGLGVDADEGQPIEKVLSQSELVDLLHASSAEKLIKEVSLPDGKVYLATATPVLAEGQRVGRVCVLSDVTHFKELDALKSDFVSTVSHDLRSPLTLMRGYATMLEMVGQLNDQQSNYVRKIVGGVESMSRLVNNLLDLGRIEAGIGLQPEMIPVYDVLERVVGALQLQAAQKRIQLTTEPPGETNPLIEADQALLHQALHNLIENAIKYTRQDGKVHVRLQVRPNGVIFEVADNGIGISPMDLPRVFEKFYRGAQQISKDERGTGLGLAIVKSIAERHGGRVWAESQLGKGSIFYLFIPSRQPMRDPGT
jgi:signal transduction histidine kinase